MKMLKKKNELSLSTLIDVAKAFTVKFWGAGVSLCSSILISRMFSTKGVGIYSLANSIFEISLILSKCGFEIALIKHITLEYRNNNHGNIKELLRRTILITFLIAFVFVVLFEFGAKWVGLIFNKPELDQILRLTIIAIIPISITHLLASAFKGVGRVKQGLFFESSLFPTALTIFVFIIVFMMGHRELSYLGISYLLAAIFTFFVCFSRWMPERKKLNNNKTEGFTIQPVVKMAFPLLLVNSTNYILNSTDTLMLGIWVSASDVGLYNVATKITLISSMLLSAVNTLLGPKIAILYSEHKLDDLETMIKKASHLMTLAAIGITIILLVGSELILSIWGNDFVAGRFIMYISLLGQFFVLATGPLATVLMMCGYEKVHRNNTLFCAVLNVILNFVLIQTIGVYGASVATSICLIVKNLYCVYAVKKYVGIRSF